jgi:hypothetical protein
VLFIGSVAFVGSVCFPGVFTLGPWGCSSTSSCLLVGLVLAGLFSLIRPCRVGVQRRWLELFFFLFFFGLLLFFGGALWYSTPAPTNQSADVLFSIFAKAAICICVRFSSCSSPAMKENSCIQNCWSITCEITISIVFLLG